MFILNDVVQFEKIKLLDSILLWHGISIKKKATKILHIV